MSMRIARPALLILYGLLLATVLLIPTEAAAQTTVKYVHTDVLGSVVAMTDASGTVVDGHREYEAYGQQLTPMVQDGPGYTGHVQDAATGLTYMQQRYYDPGIGRSLSVDPVAANANTGAMFNRYNYANNNPYRFTDPDGRQTVAIGGNGTASALGGVTGSLQLTFSFPSADPRTWSIGGLAQGGGTAGTDIGLGLSLAVSWNSGANSAEQMAGNGPEASAGGSANIFVASAGYERTLCSSCTPTHTVSVGPSLKVLPAEIHTSVQGAAGKTFLKLGDVLPASAPKTPRVEVGPLIVIEPPQGANS